MAEAVDAIGLVAGCLQINRFARQNIHTNASPKRELSPLLGKLTAHEGLIRGIKLQADLMRLIEFVSPSWIISTVLSKHARQL
jgi:hypothetical protein